MNDDGSLIWASRFSSAQVKYQCARPDGQVEANS